MIPEQTEPLCLVTWKRNTSIEQEATNSPHSTSVSSGSISRQNLMPIDPNLLRYSSNYPPSYFETVAADQSTMLQHYAALHAEYVRSLRALNMYPHF